MEYSPEEQSWFGDISDQAQWATGAWVAIMVLVLILPLRTVQTSTVDGKVVTTQVEISFRQRLMILFGLLLPALINVYSINCMVHGDCQVWAWVQTAILLAYVVIVFLMLFA